ncbi:hypothetical protein H6P81_001875 [Aristolochia fimbriata]|uniref:Uncharacterized protein n=1 Tax=Aristolochia fimbriata TaxID=158543 RepID=A0AAV7FC70_ARIFI|nr:hypothetical protein H6P81_001875 [Aristolochia fimbriata]
MALDITFKMSILWSGIPGAANAFGGHPRQKEFIKLAMSFSGRRHCTRFFLFGSLKKRTMALDERKICHFAKATARYVKVATIAWFEADSELKEKNKAGQAPDGGVKGGGKNQRKGAGESFLLKLIFLLTCLSIVVHATNGRGCIYKYLNSQGTPRSGLMGVCTLKIKR